MCLPGSGIMVFITWRPLSRLITDALFLLIGLRVSVPVSMIANGTHTGQGIRYVPCAKAPHSDKPLGGLMNGVGSATANRDCEDHRSGIREAQLFQELGGREDADARAELGGIAGIRAPISGRRQEPSDRRPDGHRNVPGRQPIEHVGLQVTHVRGDRPARGVIRECPVDASSAPNGLWKWSVTRFVCAVMVTSSDCASFSDRATI